MMKLAAILCFTLLALAARAESISYEIYSFMDGAEGKLLAQGTKNYSLSDIKVIENEYKGEVHWSKYLELEDGFKVGSSIYREPQITGFGLWAKQSPCGFSWEWFRASGAGSFRKLQEGGAVSVVFHDANGLKEIVAVHFDTDISLRLNETWKEVGGITHRILVKKGSVLKFSPNKAIQQTVALARPCR